MYDDAGPGADDGPESGGGLGRLGHDTRRTDGSPAHRCVTDIRIFSFVDFLQSLGYLVPCFVSSVADLGCLPRIPDLNFYPSLIPPDPWSQIPDPITATKEEGEKICCLPFFVATNFTQLKLLGTEKIYLLSQKIVILL
jgi:hypothetical protein